MGSYRLILVILGLVLSFNGFHLNASAASEFTGGQISFGLGLTPSTSVAGAPTPSTSEPLLISERDSTRAIALESTTFEREPFVPTTRTDRGFGADSRTRISFFAMNVGPSFGDTNTSSITATAEDVLHRNYPLQVEYVGDVPGYSWLKMLVIRLHENLGPVGDVLISIRARGISSNRVRVGIGFVGGGLPDDSPPTPVPSELFAEPTPTPTPTPTPPPAPTPAPAPTIDSLSPVISGVSNSAVNSTAATISWTTSEASDTQVEYGPSNSYGSSTQLNSSMVTSHDVSLSGLSAASLYHYRVKSRDTAGNLATSADATFTTSSSSSSGCPGFTIEGFGRNSIGGCAGTSLVVDTLSGTSDSTATTAAGLLTNKGPDGKISLREAAQVSGARIVTFAVSGIIDLTNPLEVVNSFITVDGSSAPSPGISIRGREVDLRGHDIIIRYIRFRGVNVAGEDNISIDGNDFDKPTPNIPYNIVLDHVSTSWGQDGNIDITNRAHDITVQNSIVSENLSSGHMLIGYGATNVSVHHNLFAHGYRIPELVGGNVDWVNNVMYDWNDFGRTLIFPLQQAILANIVGNYYKPGPVSALLQNDNGEIRLLGDQPFTSTSSVFIQGNIGPLRTNDTLPQLNLVWQDNGAWPSFASSRFAYPQVTTVTAAQAYTNVLGQAGANQCRDTVDARIVGEVQNGTGGATNGTSGYVPSCSN